MTLPGTDLLLLWPAALTALLLLPLLVWLRQRRGGPGALFAPFDEIARVEGVSLPRTWRTRLVRLPLLLALLGLAALVVALARPAERTTERPEQAGIDILFVIDTSSSMRSTDLARGRTRLEVARAAAARFAERRPDDRIGLLTFARYPDLRCPPTRDHQALRELLTALEPVRSEGPEDATGIGTAVARAAELLGRSQAEGRVLILLTDGEENVATKDTPREIVPQHAAQLASRLGVRIHGIAVGIGRPDGKGGLIPLDLGTLRNMAERTGGKVLAAQDKDALDGVYDEIDRIERTPLPELVVRYHDRHHLFLLVGLFLLALARVLAGTVLEVLP